MKVGFLITARLKSSRLPLKLLKEVNGHSFMYWMIKRLQLSDSLDDIILCTSTNPQDDPLVQIAIDTGIKYFRGSEEDVITRLYDAAVIHQLDYVISMTADCPLIPYEYIPFIINTFKETDADMVKFHDMPVGLILTGLKPSSMKKVIELKDSGNTEYWIYYYTKTNLFKVVSPEVDETKRNKKIRFALDYPEDYEFLKKVYAAFGDDTYKKTCKELMDYVEPRPEIYNINMDCNNLGLVRTINDPTSIVVLKDGTIIN